MVSIRYSNVLPSLPPPLSPACSFFCVLCINIIFTFIKCETKVKEKKKRRRNEWKLHENEEFNGKRTHATPTCELKL